MEEKQQLNADSDSFKADAEPPKSPEYTGPCGPCKWFMSDPLKHKSFGIFLLFGVLTIVWVISWLVQQGAAQSYIMAAIACIIMSVYGYSQFHLLLGFKEQLDTMNEQNMDFQKQNLALGREVSKLKKAEKKCRNVVTDITANNERLAATIEKFHKLDETLRNLGEDSVKGLKELQQKSETVMEHIQEGLIRFEKRIMHKVFDVMEFQDKNAGLTKDEFEEFWRQMPAAYKQRLRATGKTFEDVAGDDGIIDQQEFEKLVEEFAEKEAIAKATGSARRQ